MKDYEALCEILRGRGVDLFMSDLSKKVGLQIGDEFDEVLSKFVMQTNI